MNSHHPSPTTTLQDQIDAYWTGRAEAYHAHQLESERAPYDRALWRRVWAEALPEGHLRIADMGTGSGYVANLLADAGHQVTGVDSSPGMITAAEAETQRRRDAGLPTAEFLAGDAINPPLADASVDAVTSRYLLWTLTDPVAALRSWSRLVVPGGIIACVDAPWFPKASARKPKSSPRTAPMHSPAPITRAPWSTCRWPRPRARRTSPRCSPPPGSSTSPSPRSPKSTNSTAASSSPPGMNPARSTWSPDGWRKRSSSS